MKKRLLTLTAATLAATMVFGACGSSTGSSSSESSAASQESTEQAASTDTAEQTTTAAADSTSSAASDGSTASSSGKTTITFWHSMGGVNGDALTHRGDQYKKENKDNIYVDAEYQG